MKYSLSAILLFIGSFSFAQGSLLLVGGGSEDYNSWSDAPYSWAVQEADSGRIAIIAYGSATNWLPDYFESLGASYAANFNLSDSTSINEPSLLDTLLSYDMIFFKGGDQWNYQRDYPGTAIQFAVDSIFNRGGVVGGTSAGMAILSSWVYTAENGTIYPDEAITDTNDIRMTLDVGMWSFYSPYIFDTHYVERGRLGRLIGFSGKLNSMNESAWSLGLDDRTAICIEVSGIGEVYGTGTVSLLPPDQVAKSPNSGFAGYWTSNAPLTILKAGHEWDFVNHTIIQGNTDWINPLWGEVQMGRALLSGEYSWSKNRDFIDLVATEFWTQSFLVISSDPIRAQAFTDSIIDEGYSAQSLIINSANGNLPAPDLSPIHLWIGVEHDSLMAFFAGTDGGPALKDHYTQLDPWDFMPSCAFLGDDIRWFGSTFVDELTSDPFNAYYGDLELKEGLGLLPRSVFIPNTWDPNTSSYYENTQSALTYAMVIDSLTHGFSINKGSTLMYMADFVVRDSLPQQSATAVMINHWDSDFPFLHVHNPGSNTSIPTQIHGNGYTRQNGCFNEFLVTFGPTEVILNYGSGSVSERNLLDFNLYPNPVIESVQTSVVEAGRFEVSNLQGQKVRSGDYNPGVALTLNGLPAGYYLLRIETVTGKVGIQPFIKQ